MIQFYNGADVVDSFSITSSVSVGFENNLAKTIVFSNSVKTLSFNVFNLTTLYGATSSKVFASGVDPSDTGSAYINRLYDIYGFLISDMVQGCCPGPSFVGGVVASYPNYASFPATGQHSVIYIDESTSQAYFWDGTSYQLLVSTGITPSALTKTDDTNVTLTLGGTPGSALLQAVSITIGWTGTLADSRIASSANWNTAYTNRITSLTTTGSGAATLIANVLNIPTPAAATFSSLTTTGSSGSSTLSAGVLNVPTYTLSGLGGQPLATNLTSLAGLAYASTSFVKMTAAGTFALDTNTYLTGITSSQVTTALGYTPVTNARTISTTAPLAGGGDLTADRTLSIPQATTLVDGYLSATDWTTFNGKQAALISGTNIKTINSTSLLGSGNVAVEPTITAGTTSQYWRGDKTWQTFPTIPTVGTWGALNYPTWVSGTPFVKMTAAGTFALDTNTYLTSAITSLNGLTGATQTFANDTNVTIVSSGTAHTLTWSGTLADSRIASASTWNAKQDALVSGTNIKTINSTSLLGSGNVAVEPTITAGTTGQYYRGDKTFQTLDKTAVGLGNVDNTSDANKPVSTATQTALNLKENSANKQNSLDVDGTGVKFPTVDAVNNLSFIDKGKRMISFFTDFIGNSVTLDGLVNSLSGGTISAISISGVPQLTNQIGVHAYATGIVATNFAQHLSSGIVSIYLGNGAWVFETSINLSNLSTALERFRTFHGFALSVSQGTETDGVFFTYEEGGIFNGTAASPNWQCVTVANSVRTLTTTSTAVTASAWNKLRIEVNAAGTSVAFYVNGTLVATHTTNIPLGSNSRYLLVKQGLYKATGLTSRNMYVDYLGYENIQTTPRT
jgi:hypothetical protein